MAKPRLNKIRVRICLFIFAAIGLPFQISAQTRPFEALEMDWVMVEDNDGYSRFEWEPYRANKIGVTEKHRQMPFKYGNSDHVVYSDFSWWGWKNETLQSLTLPDGSVEAITNSPYITVSLNLHPEWLIMKVKNNTNYYAVIDVGSLSAAAGPPIPENGHYGAEASMISLCNLYGINYHIAVLPPMGQIEVSYYNHMWKYGHLLGYNTPTNEKSRIVHSSVDNGARIDFSLDIGFYNLDPIALNSYYMREEQPYWYESGTPKPVRQYYRGPYFSEGTAYYILDDYKLLFNKADMNIREHIVAKYRKDNRQISVFENEYGLLQYGSKSK